MFWVAVIFVLIVLIFLVVARQQRSRNTGRSIIYKQQPILFTPAERSFLGVLDLAVGKDFRLFGKVRVGDLLAPQTGLNRANHQVALNKINRKHLDFVLCDPGDLTVLCAIELNDKSHQ